MERRLRGFGFRKGGSDLEIVDVEREGGHEAWGDRDRVRLDSPRTAAVAVLEVID